MATRFRWGVLYFDAISARAVPFPKVSDTRAEADAVAEALGGVVFDQYELLRDKAQAKTVIRELYELHGVEV